jgi:hypothetical protein
MLIVAVKVTFVLTSAAFLTLALSRASASVRHLVWAMALGSALVLPLGALVLPAWRLPVLPRPTTSLETLTNTSGAAGLAASEVPADAMAPQTSASESAAAASASWSQLALVAWIAGVTATTLRMIVGAAGVWWLWDTGQRVRDALARHRARLSRRTSAVVARPRDGAAVAARGTAARDP